MQGQMFTLFRGMFSIDFANKKELKFWANHWNIPTEQVAEASDIATSQSINAMQQALYKLGYLPYPEDTD